MKQYKYKFSVVMPIYNVEEYIEESIESVINQDIGFKENIQMIFVNDGSPDNSEEICLRYKKMYPENIIYIKQENGGVSSARNNGRNYAEGKYINFLDSDDKWELNVFSKAYNMFEKNEEIDVIGVRQKFFEAKSGYYRLDYKFTKDRIIDIHEEYDSIQINLSSAFFRSAVVKENAFDNRVKFGEDAKLLFEVILEKAKYGVIASSLHFYRKRINETSAVQNCKNDISYYTDTIDYVIIYLIELSLKKFGKVILNLQYYIMYELSWRVLYSNVMNLRKEQKEKYIKNIKKILQFINDEIIFNLKHINKEQKIYLASLKYGTDIRKESRYYKGDIKFNNITIANLKNKDFIQIHIVEIKNNKLYLEGKLRNTYLDKDYEIYVKDNNNNKYKLEYYEIPYTKKYSFINECYFEYIGFKVELPVESVKELRIMITYQKYYTRRLYLDFKELSRMNQKVKNMYLIKDNYILITKDDKIYIEKKNKKKLFKKEILYLKELLKQKKYKVIICRILYFIIKVLKKRPIWLVSDRINMANDNGMHLFKYMSKHEKNAKVYFVIEKTSPDYKKMKKIGKVLAFDSLKYKLYFLLSSKIISSQADPWTINAFGKNENYLRDLYRFKFIFLQHGIIKDDISAWLHKLNRNTAMFVSTTKSEYGSLKNGKYGYTEEQVKLTGLPRYDNLYNNTEKQIAFMPTWRRNLSGKFNTLNGKRKYNEQFKNSEYFKFYNNLINDTRLIETLKKYGYKAIFCIHPAFEKNYIDFEGNEVVKIENEFDYQKYFRESNLLITDYSSVAFDFAYLRKPLVYSQFDIGKIHDTHQYREEYFSYQRDGFGPVCYDYETTLQSIINYIKNDCKIEKEYLDRINKFYTFNDRDNCKRVYEEILKI